MTIHILFRVNKRQRIPKGQSKMDNPEKTFVTISYYIAIQRMKKTDNG